MIRELLERLLQSESPAALRRENQRLREELEAVRRHHAEHLDEVAGIQQLLLPKCESRIDGIRYAASYRPFVNAGGDYYDVVPLPGDLPQANGKSAWGAIIADASGHGPAAAVEVAMLDAILRTYTGFDAGPAAVLNYINRHFFTRQIRKDFITAMVINFDPQSGLLGYANAGHLPALLVRGGQAAMEELNANPGIPLGVTPDFQWTDGSIPITPGDTVFLYTDGIIETRAANGEFFGLERLKSALRGCPADPQQMIDTVTLALDAFRKDAAQGDDESMLAISIV